MSIKNSSNSAEDSFECDQLCGVLIFSIFIEKFRPSSGLMHLWNENNQYLPQKYDGSTVK